MDKTIKILKNALNATPGDWETRRHLAELLNEGEAGDEARAIIGESPEIPDTEDDQLFVADLFLAANPSQAAPHIDWVLQQNKGNARAHWLKAQVFQALGLSDDARKHYTTATVLDDSYANTDFDDLLATKPHAPASSEIAEPQPEPDKIEPEPEVAEPLPISVKTQAAAVIATSPAPAKVVAAAPAIDSTSSLLSRKALEARLENTQKKAKKQNQAASVLVAGVFHALLILIAIIWALTPGPLPEPTVIMSVKKPEDQKEQVEQKAIAQNLPQRPSSSSASRASVIAANATSPLAVPEVEIEEITDDIIGAGDSFGMGAGWGNGDGGGGGGAVRFFGDQKMAKRVLYIVDYSGSMASTNNDGDSRITMLKNELIKSIGELAPSMRYTVVFFSGMPWLQNELPGAMMGRMGRDDLDLDIIWYSASKKNKTETEKAINGMPLAPNNSGTLWMGGLRPSMKISPKPDLIYFLTDGVSQDYIRLPPDAPEEEFFKKYVEDTKAWESFLAEMLTVIPKGIPINAISMEMPGTVAARLAEFSGKTGGDFSIMIDGKLYTGKRALGFGDEKHNPF